MAEAKPLTSPPPLAGSPPCASAPDGYALKHVLVLCRHGDRSNITRQVGQYKQPKWIDQYWRSQMLSRTQQDELSRYCPLVPDVPNKRDDETNFPNGHLTQTGALQLRGVGAMLRCRYVNQLGFLPARADARVINARSTNSRRCKLSAQNLLLGLYPKHFRTRTGGGMNANEEEEGESSYEQTVVRQCDIYGETMWRPLLYCPALKSLLHGDYLSTFRKREPRIRQLCKDRYGIDYDVIKKKSQAIFEWKYPRWILFAEIAHCHHAHGINKIVPADGQRSPWSKELGQAAMQIAALDWELINENCSENMSCRLAWGRVISEVKNTLQSSVNGYSPYKLTLLSGHDSTMIGLLSGLGVYNSYRRKGGAWPPYASSTVCELWEKTEEAKSGDDHIVRIAFNGNVVIPTLGDDEDKEEDGEQSGATPDGFITWNKFSKVCDRVILPLHGVKECFASEETMSYWK